MCKRLGLGACEAVGDAMATLDFVISLLEVINELPRKVCINKIEH